MPNNGTLMLFYYVIGFSLILVLAHYVTKFIAKKSNNIISAKNIKIIQNIRLDKNNRIMIIMIYSKLFILGISNNNINLIDKFDYETNESNIYDTEKDKSSNFEQYLKSCNYTKTNYNLNESSKIKYKLESIKNKLIKFIKKGNFSSDKEDKYEKKI